MAELIKSSKVVLYLSGLTCTDENFMQKAGAQREAAELGLALVSPDTSPRGVDVPGAGDDWDFGFGAGFYLNATREPYSKNFHMYDYITKELPEVLRSLHELDMDRVSLMGHSMGGHGVLTIGLKNPTAYKSVSAFSAICNPSQVPWGQKGEAVLRQGACTSLSGYLGEDKEQWRQYDATLLAEAYSGPSSLPILMDTGTDDDFLKVQLHPWAFEKAIEGKVQLTSRMQEGYDHSYFFISTFVADHLQFHAKHLHA
ncbi:hypothetical protein N2152v2_006195 [Parachlorella kessleri]